MDFRGSADPEIVCKIMLMSPSVHISSGQYYVTHWILKRVGDPEKVKAKSRPIGEEKAASAGLGSREPAALKFMPGSKPASGSASGPVLLSLTMTSSGKEMGAGSKTRALLETPFLPSLFSPPQLLS